MKLPGPEKINEPELLATQDTEVHAQVNQTKTQRKKNCTGFERDFAVKSLRNTMIA